jgi:hypothetical protein
MSPIKTAALAVLIVALGLIASIRLGNADAVSVGSIVGVAPHADLTVRPDPD